ncbi:GNAT family N-acetyltransferase [Roseibium sp. Sym1]|uniref:GNAT family N-acetyltransferase n=1 Tax=Roseibium sp. Sym1 TaxID=3016006 RepID=UPI0022B3AC9E|nr:GNAT family N-acetyltransferase [Roseibium sp. Sym1]
MDEASSPAAPSPARPEDAPALKALADRAYAHYIPVIDAIPAPMQADYAEMVRDHEVWTIRSNGALSASLVLINRDDHLLIESIAVDPDSQGRGYGRRLLDWSRRRAVVLGQTDLRLYTNVLMTDNRAWYRRAGFAETHEEQRGDKRIVHMRLTL